MADLSPRLRRVASWAELDRLLPALGRPSGKAAQAMAEALLRLARPAGGGGLSLHPAVLGRLSARLDAQGLRLEHPGWQALAAALAQAAPAALQGGEVMPAVLAVAALRIGQGHAAAMRWLLSTVTALPGTAALDGPLHEALWRLELLRAGAGMAAWAADLPPGQWVRALLLLGLGARRPMPYSQALVEHLALPWMARCAAGGEAEAALALEGLLIEHWLKREESEAHYGRWIGAWAPGLFALGQAARGPEPTRAAPADGPPVLAFIVHNGVLLAHTEVLLLALRRLHQRGDAGFRPQVWVLGEMDARFRDAFAAAGAELHTLGEACRGQGLVARLHRLRRELAARGCGAAVWLCHPHLLAFAAGLGLAPRLAWWSLKYHPPIPGPVLRLCQAGGEPMAPVTIRGQPWHILPLGFMATAPGPEARAEAARLRATLPADAVVLSTVMRIDKMDSPPFWETAAAILRQAPQAIWRYAGQQDLPGLRACLERHGVAGRAQFVGWVDPAVEAALADLYLDGWPVGSGATAAQAMMAGIPYVFRAAEEAAENPSGLMDTLWLLPRRRGVLGAEAEARMLACFAGPEGSLLRRPRSREEQMGWALDLIADAGLRRRTGAAFARFAREHVCNPDGLAEGLRRAAGRLLPRPVDAKNICELAEAR